MKYHKIRNVPIEVCTVEQKVAYNEAFSAYINFGETWKKCKTGLQRSDLVSQIVSYSIEKYKRMDDKFKSRCDIDSFSSSLRFGLEQYMDNYFIATSYKEIGECFPALYLKDRHKDVKI